MKIPEPVPPMESFLLIASFYYKQFLPWIVGKRLVQRLWYRFLSWLISNTFSHSFTVIWFLMLSAVCSSSLSSFPPNWEVEEKQNKKHYKELKQCKEKEISLSLEWNCLGGQSCGLTIVPKLARLQLIKGFRGLSFTQWGKQRLLLFYVTLSYNRKFITDMKMSLSKKLYQALLS